MFGNLNEQLSTLLVIERVREYLLWEKARMGVRSGVGVDDAARE